MTNSIFITVLNLLQRTTNTLLILVTSLVGNTLIRLRKAPYADSHWFLYSAKTTYYTARHLNAKNT